jgi:hypothetical protein
MDSEISRIDAFSSLAPAANCDRGCKAFPRALFDPWQADVAHAQLGSAANSWPTGSGARAPIDARGCRHHQGEIELTFCD